MVGYPNENMDARVVHEGSWLYPGGAERTAREIARALDAPVTVGHSADPSFWPDDTEFPFQGLNDGLRARLPRGVKELYLGLAFGTCSLEEPVVVTSGTTAKWWTPRADQVHIHYCHSPPTKVFVDPADRVRDAAHKTAAGMVDRFYADMCDRIVANSEFTARRVETYYGRSDPPVVHPPVAVGEFYHAAADPDRYFVMIGRLDRMKRAAIVARAFRHLDERLVLVGDGPLRSECTSVPGVEVRAHLTDAELADLLARATGGIAFAEREHCGLTPKEFQAAGKPVVVPDEPNLANHVEDGVTGVVVDPTEDGVVEGVRRVVGGEWDAERIRAAAETWSVDRFHEEVVEVVADRRASARRATA